MEQRKLIRLGNSSFALALPKDWIDKSGLKKGDHIFLERSANGEITISPTYKKINGENKKVLDFSNVIGEDTMKREISVAYAQDFNTFEIKGLDSDKKPKVKKLLNYLIGLEIIEDDKDRLVARDYFDLEEVNMSNFVKRIDNNIRNMLELLEAGFNEGKLNSKQFNEIYEADEDINKFYFLINKILIKGANNPSVLNMLKLDGLEMFNHWWLAYNLEHVGDEIKRIARFLKNDEIQKDKTKKISEVFLELKQCYIELINSYYKKDKDLAMQVILNKDNIMKKISLIADDKEANIAKIGEKLKQIRAKIHQINKIIIYNII
ncbi:MAG: PhoU domain-containing protein [archaeon]